MNKHISVTLTAAFLFVAIFTSVSFSQSHTAVRTAPAALPVTVIPEAQAQAPAPAFPARIIIPTAKVNTDIIPLGVTATNNLDVPHNYVEAGWYKDGIIPGQPGSAVIDGHVDNGASIPGPFKHLRDVAIGDDVTIMTSTGQALHFRVTAKNVYDYTKFPSDTVFARGSKALVNIITCHGTFLPSAGTYSERLVVTAELVS